MNNCPICEKEKDEKRVYCSFQCRNIAINKRKDYSAISKKLIENNSRKVLTRTIQCEKCLVKVEQTSNSAGKFPPNRFCSRSCANSKVHTEETKSRISKAVVSSINNKTTMRIISQRKCIICEKSLSGTGLKLCGESCRIEYFRRKRVKSYEGKGDFLLYKSLTKFDFGISSYPGYFDTTLIEQYGWYKAKNRGDNADGVSRDHIMSVVWGYKNNVNPYLLAHPANCQLMVHKKNCSKGCRETITVDEVLHKIEEFEAKHGKYYNTNYKYLCSWNEALEKLKQTL